MKEERYRVLKKLAAGGSGETYLVWDKRLERNWVMKRVALDREGQQDAVLREMAALRQIRREGIPVLADMFYEETAVCLIMEYIEGVSLEEKVCRDGAMEEKEAVWCGVLLAELVCFLHSLACPMVHGDLKPQNIIYHDGRIALLDFGGAAMIGGAGRQVSGCRYTPGYGAPELAGGYGVSQKSDMFAFGAVLFYLVTGKEPGEGARLCAVREQNPFVSEELQAVIWKCTEPEPEKRYGSMQEVLSRLRDMSESFSARRVKSGKMGKHKRERDGKKRATFQRIRSVLLTEGKLRREAAGTAARALLLLSAGILPFAGGRKGTGARPAASGAARMSLAQAAPALLPVSIRTGDGERFLVDFTAVYHTDENLMFELPLHCFEAGKEYEVTITQSEREGAALRRRTFVICAD